MNRSTVRTPVWQIALVLLGAPALEALFFVASGVSFETFSRFTFIWGAPTEYIVFAVVLRFLRRSHVSLADLGLRGDGWGREVFVGTGAGLSLFLLSAVIMVPLEQVLPSTLSRDPRPPWAALVYALALLTAFGPIEELVWRGYALRCLGEHLPRRWHAVLLASVAFGAMHWWGGPAHVAAASIMGVAFSVLYLWRPTILANITAHVVLDFPLVFFMLFPVAPPG